MTIRLRISREAYDEIAAEATRRIDVEVGGQLFGTADVDQLIVLRIDPGGDEDERKRFSLVPNRKRAQRVIERIWKESRGSQVRVGSWHTHPGGTAIPSKTDKRTAELMHSKSGMPLPVLLIVATAFRNHAIVISEVRPWVWSEGKVREAELVIEDQSDQGANLK